MDKETAKTKLLELYESQIMDLTMMSGIGKGMKEFKKSMKDEDEKPADSPKKIPSSDNKKEPLKD